MCVKPIKRTPAVMADIRSISRFVKAIFAFFALCFSFMAGAVSPYPVLEQRAARFYRQKEWNQAAAVYDLMLDGKPAEASTYGHAIVANGMRGDSPAQLRLMTRALDNHVPFDSVFTRVRDCSFALGKTDLYSNFLTSLKDTYPWMKRTIDSYLLRYYTFRRNGMKMVELSDVMLAGAPDNAEFLQLRASGLVYEGELLEAMEAYRRILALDPDNFDALVALGNYYVEQGLTDEALPYLERAYKRKPTPFVAALIKQVLNTGVGGGG